MSGSIKVAVIGVGNCASSLIQGIYHYGDANGEVPPGLLFVPIHVPDSRANALTISVLDPSAKCAETKVCAVKMEVKR